MSKLSQFIPKFKSTKLNRLAPPTLALHRSVVTHPTPPHSITPTTTTSTLNLQKKSGRKQIIYTTAPRPLIPLTVSIENHRLWNPPAADAIGSRIVERDESGRLAKFAGRFSSLGEEDSSGEGKQFAPEADLSFLEGETLQSPSKGLGKRDIMLVVIFLPFDWGWEGILMILGDFFSKKGKR